MKLAWALFVALPLQTSAAWGQSEAEINQALNNMHHEMVRCIGYNTIVASCVRSVDNQLADTYDRSADGLLIQAYRVSRSIGMSEDAHTSRMRIEWQEMNKLIQHNCTNISSLYSRYALRCQQVTTNPDSVLLEYLPRD